MRGRGNWSEMMPLTNAHTHLELTGLSCLCPSEPVSFPGWMARLALRTLCQPKNRIQERVRQGIRELQACGTSHVGDITTTWQSVEPLLGSGLQGVVYLEVLGLRRQKALERLEAAKEALFKARRHPNYGAMEVGLSLHSPYSCHPELLERTAVWCRAEGVPLSVHVAESPAETEWLGQGKIRSLGGLPGSAVERLWPQIQPIPRLRPVAYLASRGVLEARPILVHAVHVTGGDIQAIARSGCSVVHCPRSNYLLSCGRMPLEAYLEARVRVYLGTDSRASSPSLDIREEAQFACTLHKGAVDPAKIKRLVHQVFP